MSRLVAIVGPTATGKSALAIGVARAVAGEVVACDSTAVYRGVDIGTDKVPLEEQGGIPHHMVDRVEATEVYSAAAYAVEAAAVIRGIASRGRVPVLAGGTGFYYRALVRGLFPGPARDTALRSRLERIAERRGVRALYEALRRVDPASAERIQPQDRMRIIRALEVYRLTGRPLTAHFAATTSPIADFEVLTLGLRLDRASQRARIERRVDAQFARGVVDEVRRLLDAGVPADAHALRGLVYRQVVEFLQGVRDEPATRALIVRENLQYARRQETWFRREAVDVWLEGPGEAPHVQEAAIARVKAFLEAGGHVR